nr:MAG TPA: hypothetical protein [Bacteriophage sp.]DAY68838.1 MAG TPA: hypothetical protein [Caudoviricetes sp.]
MFSSVSSSVLLNSNSNLFSILYCFLHLII